MGVLGPEQLTTFAKKRFDANVTLPGGIEGMTGDAVLPPLQSHSLIMQERVLGWMQNLRIRAINTFGVQPARSELWTCGIKRQPHLRSQIDFIGLTSDLNGCSCPLNFMDMKAETPLITGMDHRPVRTH
eukprot:3736298-Karenia_brevis.AAC.1